MFIYGYTGKEKVISKGHFCCPNCQKLRSYKHIRVQKYYSIYFIPIYPVKNLGEFVQCQGCFIAFKPDILKTNPAKEIKPFLSNSQLIELWQKLADLLGCKNISQQGGNWSVNIITCNHYFVRSGECIKENNYEGARENLYQILLIESKTLSLTSSLKDKNNSVMRQDFIQKELDFGKAANSLLKEIP
jgi:hypothetical protein